MCFIMICPNTLLLSFQRADEREMRSIEQFEMVFVLFGRCLAQQLRYSNSKVSLK